MRIAPISVLALSLAVAAGPGCFLFGKKVTNTDCDRWASQFEKVVRADGDKKCKGDKRAEKTFKKDLSELKARYSGECSTQAMTGMVSIPKGDDDCFMKASSVDDWKGCNFKPGSPLGVWGASIDSIKTTYDDCGASADDDDDDTNMGSVHSKGGELGTWDIVLSDCQSGEVNGFFGVDFYAPDSDAMRLRYVHDEAMGEVVKVAIPSKKDTVLVFDRNADCSVLEGSIEKTNVKTWTPKGDIRHLNGHVKFDCKDTEGKGHVTGEATFTGCH